MQLLWVLIAVSMVMYQKQVANVGSKGLMEIIPSVNTTNSMTNTPQKYDSNRGSTADQENVTPQKLKKLKQISGL